VGLLADTDALFEVSHAAPAVIGDATVTIGALTRSIPSRDSKFTVTVIEVSVDVASVSETIADWQRPLAGCPTE
jgi:predicted thioesterase